MKEYLRKTYALTERGADGLWRATVYGFLKNITYMLPMFLLMYATNGLLGFGGFNGAYGALGFVLIGVVMFLVINKEYHTTFNETYKESANLRMEIAEGIRQLPLSSFNKKDLTDVSQTMMKDVEAIEHALSHSVPTYYAYLATVAVIGIMLLIGQPLLGLAVLAPIVLSIFLAHLSQKMQKRATKKYYLRQRKSSKAFQELIDLHEEIQSYHLSETKKSEATRLVRRNEAVHIHTELGQALPVTFSGAISFLSLGFAMVAGTRLLQSGTINVLYFAGYVFAAARLIDATTAFTMAHAEIAYISSSVDKIKSLVDAPEQTGSPTALTGFDITGEDVCFAYDKKKNVIDGIAFEAKQNTVTALVGPSGCGKSTLLRLVSRLYDYDAGHMTVDGKELSSIQTEDLFKHVSMVFQDVLLFNGSVFDNIRIGKYDATEEEVYEAAKRAGCDDFVKQLPEGYDTIIGENGSRLSGGQRQRISIARAFLKDAEIILLDEIAASLDVENEKYIQESLNRLIKNKTVMIISHRMKSIEGVDQIIVMNGGKIEACGRHEALLDESPTYRTMIESFERSDAYVY